jgi:hypothetical protein
VNSNAKFFFMDISGYGVQEQYGENLKGKNYFVISGMSEVWRGMRLWDGRT